MLRVRLIHWNAPEAAERADSLRRAGFEIDSTPLRGPSDLRAMAADPPAAIVVDLTRTPSHGRDVALALRSRKGTRHVPLVFVGGEAEARARVETLLPDAVYATWRGISAAIRKAISHPLAAPAVPPSPLAGYSGTPLPRKLGLKPGRPLALVGAPADFPATLGELPPGATLGPVVRSRPTLTLWFVRRRAELERRIARLAAAADGLWIAWPKQASGAASDLTQQRVREIGLAAGLVDFKICAIDATWSALRFSRRV